MYSKAVIGFFSGCIGCVGAMAATVSVEVLDQSGRPIPDVVFTLSRVGESTDQGGPGARTDAISQLDGKFVPEVKVIQKGTTVTFPNEDPVRHQIYSFSPAKRFVIPLFEGTAPDTVTFDQTGVVTLGCNIHDWMKGHVYVVDTPHFEQTDGNGYLAIRGIPPGRYVATAWHPLDTLPEEDNQRQIEVTEEGQVLQWSMQLRREVPRRRSRSARRGSY